MKGLLTAIILSLVFSSSVYAKKAMIISTSHGGLSEVVGTTSCEYSFEDYFGAYVHAHKAMALELKLLIGDEVLTLYSRGFSATTNIVPHACPGPFHVDSGKDWSLAWVLVSTRGKGRIIDAVEMSAGTCAP